jgi:hypothetical protein
VPAKLSPAVRELFEARNMAHTASRSPSMVIQTGDVCGAPAGVAFLIAPEAVRFQDLPFTHPSPC